MESVWAVFDTHRVRVERLAFMAGREGCLQLQLEFDDPVYAFGADFRAAGADFRNADPVYEVCAVLFKPSRTVSIRFLCVLEIYQAYLEHQSPEPGSPSLAMEESGEDGEEESGENDEVSYELALRVLRERTGVTPVNWEGRASRVGVWLLRFVGRVAVLASRARERAYAPGGAGFVKARAEFAALA
eukprot:4699637-Prymnesium_polylepis.1